MRTVQNTQQKTIDSGHFTTASAVVLMIHLYIVCYQSVPLPGLGPFEKILDRLREVLQRLPFTGDENIAKASALLLLVWPSFFPKEPTSRRQAGFKWPAIGLGTGLLLYFSTIGLTPMTPDPTQAWSYVVITSLGYLACIYGIGGLTAAISYRKHLSRFHHETGFRQEERRIETPYSLNVPASYLYNGRERKSWINLINPRRGVLIMGSPGSGKSWFLIEPMIKQLIRQNRALFVYDFKFPALTQFTYHEFLQHRKNYPQNARFYCINFTDLSTSHRCNLIDPSTLANKNDALGISRTILLSINRIWAAKQGEFFIESSINYLAALIWFLRVFKEGAYCTLPHVIELSKTSYEVLFTILNANPETRGLIGPFIEAYLNKTMEMLDGQVASARIPLSRLDSHDFYYVLSGDDLKLDINDPNAPIILCLGGDQERQEALAPVLSLYIDRLNRRINQPNRHPSALVLDEFATVRATSVLTTIATGRSNDIIPILAVQDLTQLTQQYSHDEAHQIMNTAGNLICGQVSGETARQVSQRFHADSYLKTTVSVNSSDTSISQTEHSVDAVTPAILAQLSSGEFIGVLADDPDNRLKLKGFHATLKRPDGKPNQQALPFIAPVTKEATEENFARIAKETKDFIDEEMNRIMSDPSLKQYIVRR
jgi:hypothetical protein